MDLEKERFAAKLRQLARAAGLDSDEDAARKIDVSYRQYQRWLSGESEPRASSLKQIAGAYGVPVGVLVDMPDKDQLNRIEAKLDGLLELLKGEEVDRIVAELEDEADEPGEDQRGEEPRPGE